MKLGGDTLERVYKFVEEYLPRYYDVVWQSLDENEYKQIGIFLYQGQKDNYWDDGDCAFECVKVHIEMLCGKEDDALITGMNKLRKFAHSIKDAESDIDGLDIVDVQILNKCIPLGKNQHGIQKITSNLELKFILEVDEDG